MWLDSGRAREKNKGVRCREYSFIVPFVLMSHPGVFSIRSCCILACAQVITFRAVLFPEVQWCCRSLPAAPGLSGLWCLFIRAPTPCVGSMLWARRNLCFPNGGIKRSLGLFFEHQPVNPGGGQFFPCLLVLPSRHAAALSYLSARSVKRP